MNDEKALNSPSQGRDNTPLTLLAALRQAAEARDWGTTQARLADLIGRLSTFGALTVCVTQAQRTQPLFDRYYPPQAADTPREAHMVRELLVGLVAYGFAPDQLPDFLAGEFSTPGSGQYTHAVLELCRATQRDREPQERVSLFSSALTHFVLCELAARYYAAHPDQHARVLANQLDPVTGQYTDPDAARIPMQMMADPQVAARERRLWRQIADDLATQLNADAEE